MNLRVTARALLWTWVPATLLLAGIAVQRGIPTARLLEEPAALTDAPAYTGLVSNLGALAWCTAFALLAGGAYLLARLRPGDRDAILLLAAALLTLVLLVDDVFLLHEKVLPSKAGIPEGATFVVYGVLTAVWVVASRMLIPRAEVSLLGAAFLGFAVSIAIDLIHPTGRYGLVLEEGSKFLGILAWATYAAILVRNVILEAVDHAVHANRLESR